MDNNVLLWILGGYSSVTMFLLSAIWTEIRTMRKNLEKTMQEGTRLTTIVDGKIN